LIFDLNDLNKLFDAQQWLENNYGCEFYSSNNGWMMSSCPFDNHSDTNPSFGINPSLGFYKCFGCGKQGSFLNLICDIKKITFVQAIKFVTQESNLDFKKYNSFEFKNEKFKKALIESDNTDYNNSKIIKKAIVKIKKLLDIDFDKADLMYKELDILIENGDYKTIKEKEWKI
jgi:DNA primase